jgi:hypothetical protein
MGMGPTEIVEGKTYPELIPEGTVYHLFLNHLADTSLPGQQDAMLQNTLQLPGSDIVGPAEP